MPAPTSPALLLALMALTGAAQAQTAVPADGPALAPTAPLIGMAPVADGTARSALPETASAPTQVTLEATVSAQAADDAATVLADQIVLTSDRSLIAAGGVVVWYQGTRLVASRLTVDGATGALTLEGPIHLSRPGLADAPDEAVLIADSAQLGRTLQDGILRGARLVIARELQLAATEVTRTEGGRLTTLSQVVASSCQVCANDPTPLWEIRARRITHDAETRDITFEAPQFRALGLPIAGLPFTITAPDPTVDRRSGFLRPQLRTTSGLGFGIKTPYFITLGPQADLTLTPYVAAESTRTLEARYRQALSFGAVQIEGAVSRDDMRQGETHGYLFGSGTFDLPRGYRLGAQVQWTSDRAYLLDYGISEADRLWSGFTVDRVTRDRRVTGRVGQYRSLRPEEDNATTPAQVADLVWERRVRPALIGGEALLSWSVHAHRRPSDADILGRDMARGSLHADWRGSRILPGGVVAGAQAALDADLYRIADDDRFDAVITRATPMLAAELRWPLIAATEAATHLVEPVAQIVWSPRGDAGVPNEDSRLIEFDEGNLFDTDRFPGRDARETGWRANLGVSWTRLDPTGWSLGMTVGRVLRDEPDPAFGPDSPLTGRQSDWLVSGTYDSGGGLVVVNRALFDDDFNFSRNETRVGWLAPGVQLSAGYLWIDSDRGESRAVDVSEVTANAGWQIAPGWWGTTEARYDFNADRMQRAGLGIQFRNECLTVDMGATRRFTGSDSLSPQTDFDLSVRLGGFGRQKDGPGTVARRSCLR